MRFNYSKVLEKTQKSLSEETILKEIQKEIECAIDDCDTFAELLKTWRTLLGYTQKSLAEKVGTCRQHVQKWEYDICKPKRVNLKKICLIIAKKDMSLQIIKRFYIY